MFPNIQLINCIAQGDGVTKTTEASQRMHSLQKNRYTPHYCQEVYKTSYKGNDKCYVWKESKTIRKTSLSKNIGKCCKMSTMYNVGERWYHVRADISLYMWTKFSSGVGHLYARQVLDDFLPPKSFLKTALLIYDPYSI